MIGRNSSCTAEALILTLTAELPPGGGSADSAICKQSLYDNKERLYLYDDRRGHVYVVGCFFSRGQNIKVL